MFKKSAKKTKPILFKKFQEERILEEKMAEFSKMSENTTKKVNNLTKKDSVKRIQYLKTDLFTKITVGVTNINETVTGRKNVVLLLANYFSKMKKRVCVVTDESINIAAFNDIEVITKEELYDLYDSYDVIIYDFGDYQNIDKASLNELKRCLVKIMITQYQNEILEDMAKFIMSQPNIKSWIFYFMYVPERQKKDVDALMEDYKYYVLPLFTPNEIEKSLNKIITDTFKIYEVLGIGGI